jgi:hypothetical protein
MFVHSGKEPAMCYEYSGWFRELRRKEAGKARERADVAKRPEPAVVPPQPARQESRVTESEKLPA